MMNRRTFTAISLLVGAAFPLAVAAQSTKPILVNQVGRISSVSTGSITLDDRSTVYLNRPTPDYFPRTEIFPNGKVLTAGQHVIIRGMRMPDGTINALKIQILGKNVKVLGK